MLIINNSANFTNMPAFGGINLSQNLVFGLRANSPTNTVNLSDAPNKAVITKNNVDYSNAGIVAGNQKNLKTNLATTSKDLTLKAVVKLKNLPTNDAFLAGIAGNYDSAETGLGLLITSIANAANYDYELRAYIRVIDKNNTPQTRVNKYKFATDKKLSETDVLNIWFKVDSSNAMTSLKINDDAWSDLYYTGDNMGARNDKNWIVGGIPRFETKDGVDVIISELLVWDKILTSAEIDQQNKLSQRWLSTLA